MDALTYLERIKKIDKLIENKRAEIDFWKDVAGGVSVSVPTAVINGETVGLERVKSSSDISDRMAEAVSNYVDIETAYGQELAVLAKEKRDIIRTIEELPLNEYEVLYHIYVEHKTAQEVIDIMDKSRSWVASIHSKAPSNIQKILDER